MYTLEKWNLSDLVSFKNIDSSFQELESLVSTFEKFEPLFKKTISIPDFKKILELLEHIYVLSSKISAYSYLWYSEDTTNQQAISFKVKVEKILSDLEQRMLFFSLSFKLIMPKSSSCYVNQVGYDKSDGKNNCRQPRTMRSIFCLHVGNKPI